MVPRKHRRPKQEKEKKYVHGDTNALCFKAWCEVMTRVGRTGKMKDHKSLSGHCSGLGVNLQSASVKCGQWVDLHNLQSRVDKVWFLRETRSGRFSSFVETVFEGVLSDDVILVCRDSHGHNQYAPLYIVSGARLWVKGWWRFRANTGLSQMLLIVLCGQKMLRLESTYCVSESLNTLVGIK